MTVLLTPHFSLEELVASDTAEANGIDNTAPLEVQYRLAQLAGKLEDVRALFGGKAITISSGYRCPALNSLVGGAGSSAHLYGCAADFICPEFGTPYMICAYLTDLLGFTYDQLINEEGSGARWVHLGLPVGSGLPRNQDLTIASGVTQNGFYPV